MPYTAGDHIPPSTWLRRLTEGYSGPWSVTRVMTVLSRRLPAVKTTNFNLRLMAHGFTLREEDNCNYIPRMPFERIYC